MSVIVPDGMPIDQALKLLWREANRENIPAEIQKKQFRVKPSAVKHALNKNWIKRKRRARAFKRKLRRKGQRRTLLNMQ